MARRAVEAFLKDNPEHLPTSALAPSKPVMDQNSDSHPYNMGLVWASLGSLDVFMFTDSPGVYWLDMLKHRPASDAQAKAAFCLETFHRHRQEGAELAQDQRINSAVDQAVTARDAPEQSEAEQRREELRRQAAKAVRAVQKETQAATAKQFTKWLETP
jgi:hypothetical protein